PTPEKCTCPDHHHRPKCRSMNPGPELKTSQVASGDPSTWALISHHGRHRRTETPANAASGRRLRRHPKYSSADAATSGNNRLPVERVIAEAPVKAPATTKSRVAPERSPRTRAKIAATKKRASSMWFWA